MRKNNINFIIFSLLSLSFFLLFVKLSHWQYQRNDQKKHLMQQLSSYAQEKSQDIQDISSVEVLNNLPEYSLIKLTGRWLTKHSLLIVNKYHDHQLGFNLVTPFILETEKTVILVNRGWLLNPDKIQNVDDSTNPVTIDGLIKNPNIYQYIMGKNILESHYRFPTIQKIDFKDTQFKNLVIERLNASPINKQWKNLGDDSLSKNIMLLLNPKNNSLITNWQISTVSPSKHMAYAIQWLLLAISVVLLYSYFYYKTYRN